ncbi:MAG: hypothetical protein IKL52_03415 [Candidatus Gastranaerophilales bacterium]|nr:hypothetical protein [Candidatus Gastranaerophilales bacterium]
MKIANSNLHFRANKMSTMQARYVDNQLKKARNVDIICHDMTDRDGANSALAMWEYLNSQGVCARVIISQKTPEALGLRTYDFKMVQASDNEELSKIKPDIAFCVDFGAQDRVALNVLEHIKNTPKVMGFDHHSEVDIAQDEFIQFQRPLKKGEFVCSRVPFYSDTTAKSATSVIYRFFEALDKEIDNSRAYDLFLGLVDDGIKRGLVKCDGEKGTIVPQKKLIEDENAFEIYQKLEEKLSSEDIKKIAKTIDIMSSLTPEQKAFRESLKNRIRLSDDGKIAYVEIKPNDEQWKSLGGDNTITSTILNRFRQEILASNEYRNVDAVITFYEANGKYRLSAHTRKPNLLKFFEYVEKNKIENFTNNSGGHSSRGGGSIKSIEPEVCHKWVQDIVVCDDFFWE